MIVPDRELKSRSKSRNSVKDDMDDGIVEDKRPCSIAHHSKFGRFEISSGIVPTKLLFSVKSFV